MTSPYPFKSTAEYEGFSSHVYMDTTGHPTIGFGFNLSRADASIRLNTIGLDYNRIVKGQDSITFDQGKKLMAFDYDEAEEQAKKLMPNYNLQPEVVQLIMNDLVYNRGYYQCSLMTRALAAIYAKDYPRAAIELQKTKWYKLVKRRSKDICDTLNMLGDQHGK